MCTESHYNWNEIQNYLRQPCGSVWLEFYLNFGDHMFQLMVTLSRLPEKKTVHEFESHWHIFFKLILICTFLAERWQHISDSKKQLNVNRRKKILIIMIMIITIIKIIITIIIIILRWEIFTPALASGLPLEFEWQQVSSGLQDSSQYSGRSQQCCCLYGLHSCSYLQVLQPVYQSLGDCTERTSYNCYHRHFLAPLLF